MSGPLEGVRVVELAGLGPAPFAAMMLADMGADVLRVDRASLVFKGGGGNQSRDLLARGRRSVGVDLKNPRGVELVLGLAEGADALIEGFRPGVAERIGIGPAECAQVNPRLVYGRMTGWGQDGPLSPAAGHDINYIALAGALNMIGRSGEAPVPPLNLVGDFGGGGMLLAFGVVCALFEARSSGRGQVVDASMVDGAALLTTMIYGLRASGIWGDERGTNLLDGGAPFYDVYETKDHKFVAIGALEPQFYSELLRLTGLDQGDLPPQMDRSRWGELRERLEVAFASRTRAEWCQIMEGSEACFAPVLDANEVGQHPHNLSRGTFVEVGGVVQPGAAPRFSRTPGGIASPPSRPGQDSAEALARWGLDNSEIEELIECGAVADEGSRRVAGPISG